MTTKKCSSCQHEQPIEMYVIQQQYYKLRTCDMCRNPDNYGHKYCSVCNELKSVERYDKRLDSPNRRYKASCRDCVSQYQREYRAKTRYGTTHEILEAMKDNQNRSCAICFDTTKLVIDHNHDTGEVRAILCDLCNRGLGYFKDNPQLLVAASNYLLEKGYAG
jgi:hypothetical protein